jgi:hypothetical protein
MRIKSHWFRSEKPKSAQEIAGRPPHRLAHRAEFAEDDAAARFDLPPGRRYFASSPNSWCS